MTTALNPLSELGRTAVETSARLTKISIDSAERAFAINLEYAKAAVAQATLTARAAAGVQDVEQFLTVRNRLAENAVENLVGYSRSLYEVASEAQSELSKLAEERMAAYQAAVVEAVDQASKVAPGSGDVAVAAVKQSMAATTAAFDTLHKAARQVASYADASVKAAKAPKTRK
jgi:phasin family protein